MQDYRTVRRGGEVDGAGLGGGRTQPPSGLRDDRAAFPAPHPRESSGCPRLRARLGFSAGSAGEESAAMREIWVGSLGWEDALEKGKPPYSSILAWRIPWTV